MTSQVKYDQSACCSPSWLIRLRGGEGGGGGGGGGGVQSLPALTLHSQVQCQLQWLESLCRVETTTGELGELELRRRVEVMAEIQTQHFLISLILIFTSEIGPFWLEIVGYLISVLNRLGQKRNLSQWDLKNIWILVVTDKE